MKHIFDIETRPDYDRAKELAKPFDPASVKMANLKDPAKRAAKLEQAEADYMSKILDKASLEPSTSSICAIGVHLEGYSYPDLLIGDEKEILIKFRNMVSVYDKDQFMFWTGSNDRSLFDIRHIIHRCWVHNIHFPQGFNVGGKLSLFVDMTPHYLIGASYPAYCGADRAAKELDLIGEDVGFAKVLSKDDLEVEGVTGKDFWKVLDNNRELAEKYLINDLALERAICNRIY